MQAMLNDEELMYIDKEPFNWTVKEDCPKELRKDIEKKLAEIRRYGKEVRSGKIK